MHSPPFVGKWIDLPGVYSSVDDGLGGLCAIAAFMFSSAMKGIPMYKELKPSKLKVMNGNAHTSVRTGLPSTQLVCFVYGLCLINLKERKFNIL
jgi:hypothetical protein